jgi:hypothetical protein
MRMKCEKYLVWIAFSRGFDGVLIKAATGSRDGSRDNSALLLRTKGGFRTG